MGITESITQMMHNRGYTVQVYMDDFIIENSQNIIEVNLLIQLCLLQEGSIYISLNICCLPSQKLLYLGVLIDTVEQKVSVVQARLRKLKNAFRIVWGRKGH